MKRFCLALLLIGGIVRPGSSPAQNVTSLRVEQAYVNLPKITAFMDVRSQSGKFVADIDSNQLSVSAGTASVALDRVRSFQETNRGVAYVFLVDVSKSLQPEQFDRIQEALRKWIGGLGTQDRAALMTFGSEVELVHDFTSNYSTLISRIDSLSLTDNRTKLHAGLKQATTLGRRRDPSLPERRAIVVLSDGRDDVTGGVTAQEVRDHIEVDRIPIYAIGYYAPPRTEAKEAALDKLGTFARASGGRYIDGTGTSIKEGFSELRSGIEQALVAEMTCSSCRPDGSVQRLQVQLTAGKTRLSDGLRVRMRTSGSREPAKPQTKTKEASSGVVGFLKQMPWWGYALAAFLLIASAAGIYVLRGEDEEEEEMGEPEPDPAPQPTPKIKSTPDPEPHTKQKKPSGLPLRLDVLGGAAGDVYEVDLVDEVVIGRSEGQCDVALTDDEEASRQNSEIRREEGALYIRDLDSMNGTLVNGVPISGRHRLEDGDRILVGRTEMRISIPEDTFRN